MEILGTNCQFLQRISKKKKKKASWDFPRLYVESVDQLREILPFKQYLISPSYEHWMSLYLFWPLIC